MRAQAVTAGTSVVDAGAAPATSYPSSAKTHRNWDSLASDLKQEEKDEKLDGEAGLQKFFKQLYGDLDDDSRRAMVKSFQARSLCLCRSRLCACATRGTRAPRMRPPASRTGVPPGRNQFHTRF